MADLPNIAQLSCCKNPSGNKALTSATCQHPPMLQVSSLGTIVKLPVNLVALTCPKSQVPVPLNVLILASSINHKQPDY